MDHLRDAIEKPLNGTTRDVRSFDGTNIHVEHFGPQDAQTIVLVHGWTQAIDYWTLQIQALASDYHVVAMDHRGHGQSEKPANGDYSIDAFAADLDAVLADVTEAGAPLPIVCGHSLGGITIMHWARMNAGRVSKKISGAGLFSTGATDLIGRIALVPGVRFTGTIGRLGLGIVLGAPVPIPGQPRPVIETAVKLIAFGSRASASGVRQTTKNILRTSPRARSSAARMLVRVDVLLGCQELDVPSAVLVGAQDKITPPAQARLISRSLPNLIQITEVRGVGHQTSLECPEIALGAILSLLERAGVSQQQVGV